MTAGFGFWILDFGLGFRPRVLRANRQLCPNRRTGNASFPHEEIPPRGTLIQNPKPKIQNNVRGESSHFRREHQRRRSAADGL